MQRVFNFIDIAERVSGLSILGLLMIIALVADAIMEQRIGNLIGVVLLLVIGLINKRFSLFEHWNIDIPRQPSPDACRVEATDADGVIHTAVFSNVQDAREYRTWKQKNEM